VVTASDIRWGRCDIKTTGLLANALAKTEARKKGAFESWLVDRDGFVTEGASTNAWIVTGEGVLVTRSLSPNILAGVTRLGVLSALAAHGANAVEERVFTVEEAKSAREAFITSASGGVLPVTTIDGGRSAMASRGRRRSVSIRFIPNSHRRQRKLSAFSLRNRSKGR
jgi:D-alanine transaminase